MRGLQIAALAAVGVWSSCAEEPDPAAEFRQRVAGYAALRQSCVAKKPALPKKATAQQIAKYEADLAQQLRDARSGAKVGDIFTERAQTLIRRHLSAHLSGPVNKDIRAAARQGNPKTESNVPVPVAVNAVYPKMAPLSTVPPSLLLKLPSLPEGIQYRFVGSTLILWDSASGLIIDYMKGVAPGL